MTDTEILDSLQESYTLHRNSPHDVVIGRVLFTTGLRPGTIRELMIAAIEREQQRRTREVASKLKGA